MTPARRLGLPLLASVLTHAYAAWHLYAARQEPLIPDRDRFEVRMLTLPPPAMVEPPPPPPEVPALPKPLPPPSPPRVKPAAPEQPPEPAPAPETAESPAPPVAPPGETAVTAPPALLAQEPSAVAAVVQRTGSAFGSFASGGAAVSPSTARARAPGRGDTESTAVTRLSDLSRKPRAPSLDAALRRHYPIDLRRRGVEGQAEVRVLVAADGRVGQVNVVSESAAGFGRACKDTLFGTQWSEPVDRDGKPVNTRLTYRCRFVVGD